MARKKKLQIEKHPGVPRGAEHLPALSPTHPTSRLDEQGREILSDEPIVLHLKRRTVTDLETLRLTIQQIRASDGPIVFETFQEADDFDVDDDFGEFQSQWEIPADGDLDRPDMPTAEEYVRYRTTGELPRRFFQDKKSPPAAPPAESSSGGVQPPAPPDSQAGKP